jgi:hypothetical protein
MNVSSQAKGTMTRQIWKNAHVCTFDAGAKIAQGAYPQ